MLVALALLTAQAVQAQSTDEAAAVQGSVHDSQGSPIFHAVVYLQREGETQRLSAQTDAAGNYRFSALSSGAYKLWAEAAGHDPGPIVSLSLGDNDVKKLDLVSGAIKGPSRKSSSGTPEFFDEPNFTVAGVTDAANPGGHGSSIARRTTETLAKETVALGPGPSSRWVSAREKALNSSHQASTNSSDVAAVLADVTSGKYEMARDQARVLLTKSPPAVEQAELHNILGKAEENLGDPLEAVREYQRAAELDPSESNLFDWGAELLLHRAFEQATEVFSKGSRLFPRSVRILSGLGVAWYARGAYDQAFQALCQASDLNPADPQPYLFLGRMQNVETVQPSGLTERLEGFARLKPDNPWANYYYAMSLWKRSPAANLDRIESLLEKAVSLDPHFGVAYLQLGNLYSDRQNFSTARAAYQKAIEVTPDLVEAHYRLARLHEQMGDKVKAQGELETYQQLSKEKEAIEERQRREIQEFVFTSRQPK